jgi:hypothetical protein
MMPANPRLGAPGSRGHPPDLLFGLCYAQTQAALAQSLTLRSAIGWQPMLIECPSGPRWQP